MTVCLLVSWLEGIKSNKFASRPIIAQVATMSTKHPRGIVRKATEDAMYDRADGSGVYEGGSKWRSHAGGGGVCEGGGKGRSHAGSGDGSGVHAGGGKGRSHAGGGGVYEGIGKGRSDAGGGKGRSDAGGGGGGCQRRNSGSGHEVAVVSHLAPNVRVITNEYHHHHHHHHHHCCKISERRMQRMEAEAQEVLMDQIKDQLHEEEDEPPEEDDNEVAAEPDSEEFISVPCDLSAAQIAMFQTLKRKLEREEES